PRRRRACRGGPACRPRRSRRRTDERAPPAACARPRTAAASRRPLGGREPAKEPMGEPLPPLARGLEPRALRVDLSAGAHRDLPAVVLALADHPRDLVVAVFEDLPEQEDRSLDRRQALEQDEEGH